MTTIAVMGAGAVGCYYGGLLARAGHEVTLIGRAAHVPALQRDGLCWEAGGERRRIAVRAAATADGARGAALVLFSVKSTDTEAAARELAPHLAPGAVVLCLQNGVDNAERLQAVLADRAAVVPAVVYVAVEMAGPGHVRHHGRGELELGPGPHSARLVDLLSRAGVPAGVSDNVAGALWAKLVVNCAYNALSALSQQPYGPLWRGAGVQAVMRDVVDECLAVARAEGVAVPGDAWAAVQRIARTMPTQRSSTAQDLARGRRSEIDHLNGHVVRRGEALGVPTPANRVLHALVRLREDLPSAA